MGAGGAVTTSKPRVRLQPTPRVKLISVHKAWAGRNSKLTEAVLAEIVENLLIGMPIASVCDLVEISIQTWSNWKKHGEKYLETGEPVEHEIYGRLVIETRKAIATWEKKVVQRSLDTEGYKPSWARDLTLLERRKRDDWGDPARGSRPTGEIDPDMKFL